MLPSLLPTSGRFVPFTLRLAYTESPSTRVCVWKYDVGYETPGLTQPYFTVCARAV
jgi:hypothetical protein